ncbi:MAG: hypothetical protein J1E06_09750, partial [Acutalibacter sp.]|nr:hypothetical protein [Acutalibacter sp.]
NFQFIVLLIITQIAGNSNGLAAETGRDVKVGKLKTATSKTHRVPKWGKLRQNFDALLMM